VVVEGAPGDSMFALSEGTAGVFRGHGGPNARRVASIAPGDIFGEGQGPVKAEYVTDQVWDFVLQGASMPEGSPIGEETLKKMKREFEYWYPWDLRVSGTDLIQNHRTFSLYNHTAFFPKEQWPRSIRCNGHLLLNSEKMSKSKGKARTCRCFYCFLCLYSVLSSPLAYSLFS
jgi:hypothetical protein